MPDKLVITILPMGGGKGRLPERSMAGSQRAAGILPAPSREAQAAAQVQTEMSRERVSKPFTPNVAGTVVPAEFQDTKTFRGVVADSVAVRGSTGSGGIVKDYIDRSVPAEFSDPKAFKGVTAIAAAKPKQVAMPSLAPKGPRLEFFSDFPMPSSYVAGRTKSSSKPFSPELIADILEPSDNASRKGEFRGKTRRRGFFGFLDLGRVGDVADGGYSGGHGARAGLSGDTKHFNRTILSRALERMNMRGVARFASYSSLGAAVGAVQVGAGIARIYSQVELARINRESAVAATAYKRMREDAVLSDVLTRGGDIKGAEVTSQFLQTAQDFAPLVGIMAALVIQSKFPDLPMTGKIGSTLFATATGASVISAVATKFASEGPQAAQYVADTLAQNVRSHMVQNRSFTLGTTALGNITVTGNEGDFHYLDQAKRLLNGQSGMMLGKQDTTAAAWAGVTSPFDVIRASMNRASSPKIGVGAVNQSTRTAFKAEQETSLPKADNAIFRRLMKQVGLRNSSQLMKERLIYR